MKKLLLFILTVVVLSGCGKVDTLSCSGERTVNGITSSTKYVVDHKDNDIKKISIVYEYKSNNVDGVNTGTDGTTSDDNKDNDGIMGGEVLDVLDDVIGNVTDGILDIAGIKTRHNSRFGTYTNINGFTSDVDVDLDNDYRVKYVYDLTKLSDSDVSNLGITRDYNTYKNTITNRGLTCK